MLDVDSLPQVRPDTPFNVWFKLDYSAQKGPKPATSLVEVSVDCPRRTVATLQTVTYQTLHSDPKINRNYDPPSSPIPESWGEHVLAVLCFKESK